MEAPLASRQAALLSQVFAALRPPAVEEAPASDDSEHDLGRRLCLEVLCQTPDYAELLVAHIVSRADLGPLACASKRLAAAVRKPPFADLGMFRTPFGAEHGCRLQPHQLRSLRHMRAAEDPPGWRFGELRGGILADDPGLGKTVTMLALIVRSAGTMPGVPSDFWDTEDGWAQLRSNPVGHRALLKLLNAIHREFMNPLDQVMPTEQMKARFQEALAPLLAFANYGARSSDEMRTLNEFERAVGACLKIALEARGEGHRAPNGMVGMLARRERKRLCDSVRQALNEVRSGLDRHNRAFHVSPMGRRALFERNLLAASCTLVVVPMALLEHWFEQIRRHVDLCSLSSDGCGHGVVWIDGMGDMSDLHDFRLRAADLIYSCMADEYVLAAHRIVLTTYERCASEASRSLHCMASANSPLMRLRWLRLVVDEGHELGSHEVSDANRFIAALPAERRWVMSGTPTAGRAVAGHDGAIAQLGRLLGFLREPKYGLGLLEEARRRRASSLWHREVAKPMLSADAKVVPTLVLLLQPLMVRHTKADLHLPEPIFLPVLEASLNRAVGERERDFTARVCRNVAAHVLAVMREARHERKRISPSKSSRAALPAKAVVYSDFQNDLEQVINWLVQMEGNEKVAQHWGDFRSTELARFRTGRTSFRECPRCGFHNEQQVRGDSCDRPLLDILLAPHDAPANWDQDEDSRMWPVEQERVYIRDPTAPSGWRRWEQHDFERFRTWGTSSSSQRLVWVSTAPGSHFGSRLPPPTWPPDVALHSPGMTLMGGPGGLCLPGRLRGWGRCGSWHGPPRENKHGSITYRGCPPGWTAQGVFYDESSHPILRPVPWSQKILDTYILVLCEDGSHGLDLSFVTHLFIVNPIKDPAKFQQVVSRAHRMGAQESVRVETIHLWND
ncbi:hypothetical protein AB1Y20_017724 [Prymnesium parvum]|uniref:Helicase ATP-binding domain-containing protein n=1 Tax=Prymnesium parvum TaxID=97485 RepID=A0AB34JP89_PRYPA